MTDALVTIKALTKRYEGNAHVAIDNLTTVIKAAQVTELVGPDGAGKTTLMRLMAALLSPSSGTISVCGLDVVSEAAAIHDTIGYMPQRFGLYEDLSVIENLNLYADLRGVLGIERRETFERVLAFTNLAPFTGRLAGALSGGMKQKLGLACAMLRSPRLLLLDEPSVGVDPISRRELWRMVYALIEQGVGVVWSTAYLDEARELRRGYRAQRGKRLVPRRSQGDDRANGGPRVPTARRRGGATERSGQGINCPRCCRRRHARRGHPAGPEKGQECTGFCSERDIA